MTAYGSFNERRFLALVDKALKQVQSILDTTKHPRLVDVDVDHTYDDKFLLTEAMTNTSLAAIRTSLDRLGVAEEHWTKWLEWAADEKAVTLRFQASETCEFLQEKIVEVDDPVSIETTTTSSWNRAANKTTKTKVKRQLKENHWKVTLRHSLIAFPGRTMEGAVTICTRETSTTIVMGSGASARDSAPPPIPAHTDHPPLDWNITWFLKQLRLKENGIVEGHFTIDREMAKTPRNNESTHNSEGFHQQGRQWAFAVKRFFTHRIEKTIMGQHKPVTGPRNYYVAESALTVSRLKEDSVFCPFQPFLEDGAVLTSKELNSFLEAHDMGLNEVLEELTKSFPPAEASALLSVVEANITMICLHVETLTSYYDSCITYMEHLMYKQLVKAIGKEVTSEDFTSFMRYHSRRLLAPLYAPHPFSHAVRRPGHAPDGVVSIESQDGTPIESIVRHVDSSQQSASLQIPLNASTVVAISGDWYLHGWMMHQFAGASASGEFSLAARARQFSSFMLVIGTMAGGHQLEPKHAIILQNKDELVIPLLTEVLPSAKDFKDAISSLSPEQQDFCKAFRTMQLESSVFGVAIVQLKPQLEKLLGLLPHSLTKEIQLTQDLMTLFIEYQIPSDLLSFDGPEDTSKADRLAAVKGHVKAVLEVINSEKEKTIVAEEQKADYREARFSKMEEEILQEEEEGVGKRGRGSSYADEEVDFDTPHWGAPRLPPPPMMAAAAGAVPLPRGKASYGALARKSRAAFGETNFARFSISKSASEPPPPSVPAPAAATLYTAKPEQHVVTDFPPFSQDSRSTSEDFTLLPKELDSKLERLDTDNSLHSTVLKAGTCWKLQHQENLLSPLKSSSLSEDDIKREKKKAFDLLDAISQSGSLAIEAAELHVIVALSHCFEKDLMNTVIEDNINPIAKAEKSTILLASTVHKVAPAMLLTSSQDTNRLEAAFPMLFHE